METITKNAAMSWYNKARTAARQGKLNPVDVNRALGVLMAADGLDRIAKYHTTIKTCECPHHRRTGRACKHMIACMILARSRQTETAPASKNLNEINGVFSRMSDGSWVCAEKVSGGYNLHAFEALDLAKWWVKTQPHGILARWADAAGSRKGTVNHGAIDHPEFYD